MPKLASGGERVRALPADLAIVVVTFNSVHVVGDLLGSLPEALGDLVADVVVVDNGSTDGTVDLLRQRDDCRVVESTNVGFAGGINRGVREAPSSELVLALNPDVRLHPSSVVRMVDILRRAGAGAVVPQVLNADGSLHYSLRREPTLARTLGLTPTRLAVFAEHLNRPQDYDRPQVVDWALGAVVLFSRECFDALGGWDETYFLYSEETDFCLRAGDLGYDTRYEPSAVATHIGGQSGQSDKTHVMKIVNRVRCYRRRHSLAATWAFYLLTLLREVSWIGRGGSMSRAAVLALLIPQRRPAEIGCSRHVIPS